jgi:hypothetical protein
MTFAFEKLLVFLKSVDCADAISDKNEQLPARSGTRRGDILLHVCTHAQYTVAHVVTML